MPKTTQYHPAARRPRKGAQKRNERKIAGRPGVNGKGPQGPTVIANSLFALTLTAKPGMTVLNNTDGMTRTRRGYDGREDDYTKMYEDLFAAFKIAYKLVNGETTSYNPIKDFEIGMALNYVVEGFTNHVLPKTWHVNVDRDDSHYYFTIYRELEFSQYWHAFEIKPVVTYLKQYNKKLHDLFLILIYSFITKMDLGTWWNGGMQYAEYMAMDPQWDDDFEDDDEEQAREVEIAKRAEELQRYDKGGEAFEYEELIRHAGFSNPAGIRKAIRRLKSRNPVAKWMLKACDYMEEAVPMSNFVYEELSEDEGWDGVKLEDQVTIVWDIDDAYTVMQDQANEANANGFGIMPPIQNYRFGKNTKHFDIDELNVQYRTLDGLTALHKAYDAMIDKIKPKAKKK